MALAIIASSMFIENFLLIYHLKHILTSPIEISGSLIEKIFEMKSLNKTALSESEDPNLVWSNWKTKFLRVVNSHAPIRTRRAKLNNIPWINSALKNDMRCRDAAKRRR